MNWDDIDYEDVEEVVKESLKIYPVQNVVATEDTIEIGFPKEYKVRFLDEIINKLGVKSRFCIVSTEDEVLLTIDLRS
jgi:hypothetical protein